MIGVGIVALAHMAPTRFLLDAMAGDRAVWSMPRTAPSTVYLTYDDGPNPTTTPDLLDVLAREGVHATFFLIDAHITEETAPIVRRMFEDGHAVGLHSASRRYMLMSPSTLARTLTEAADRIERLGARGRAARSGRTRAGAAGRCSRDSGRSTISWLAGAGCCGTSTGSAHRGQHLPAHLGARFRRRHHRYARRRRVGPAQRPAAHGGRDGTVHSRVARPRPQLRDSLPERRINHGFRL